MGEELRQAQQFARDLAEVYGSGIRSVVLYGSAAREQFHQGSSDLNVLVLFRQLDAGVIRRGSSLARRWVEQGNPPPLLLSEDELRRSLDIFAIEYSDIRDAHRVLHGDDPFADLEIRSEHLRLQCERELKSALIQLREWYLLTAGEPDELGNLLRRSISTLLVLFRTVLRLSGDAVPPAAEEVVRATAERVGFEAAPLLDILRARRSGETLRPAADDPLVDGYLEAVAASVRYIDRLPTPGAGG
jgi:predicted nucleotidyltransferase